jgi:hypothetical protein
VRKTLFYQVEIIILPRNYFKVNSLIMLNQ